jgi:hypothetical protein
VPKDHPRRVIRGIVDHGLPELSGTFSAIHSDQGRPNIPPERLPRALLPQARHGLRSAASDDGASGL